MSEDAVKAILDLHGDKTFVEQPAEDDVEHHGVKGQKWGVRRNQSKGESLARAKAFHDSAATSKRGPAKSLHENRARQAERSLNKVNRRIVKKGGTPVPVNGGGRRVSPSSKKNAKKTQFQKPPTRLTDKQLQERISRMELEKKYNTLNAKELSNGRKFTNDIMNSTGKQVATTILAGGALYLVAKGIEKKFGVEPARAITNKQVVETVREVGGVL